MSNDGPVDVGEEAAEAVSAGRFPSYAESDPLSHTLQDALRSACVDLAGSPFVETLRAAADRIDEVAKYERFEDDVLDAMDRMDSKSGAYRDLNAALRRLRG